MSDTSKKDEKPREFWALKGKHSGSKWHLYLTLTEAERKITELQKYRDKDYELIKLVETYETLQSECDELKAELEKVLKTNLRSR